MLIGLRIRKIGRRAADCCVLDFTWPLYLSVHSTHDSTMDGGGATEFPLLVEEIVQCRGGKSRSPVGHDWWPTLHCVSSTHNIALMGVLGS